MKNAKRVTRLAAAAWLLGAAGAADAAVLFGTKTGGTATGGVVVIAPPAEVGNDNQQSDNVFAWNEQQNVLLESAIVIDLGGTSIAAGTWISSHGIVFDSIILQQTSVGSITFDSAILGIVLRTDNLPGSDFLGAGGTIYNTVTGRGSEPLAHDTTSFAGNVLSFNWRSGTPGDNIRVLTAGTPGVPAVPDVSMVPEPATWAMMVLGFGLVGFAARRSGAAARTVA